MSDETSLNSQIVESVQTVQTFVHDAAPAVASAATRQQVSVALGLAVQNAVAHLQSLQTLDVAVTAQSLSLTLSEPDGSGAAARAQEIMQIALRSAIQQIAELTQLALSVQGGSGSS